MIDTHMIFGCPHADAAAERALAEGYDAVIFVPANSGELVDVRGIKQHETVPTTLVAYQRPKPESIDVSDPLAFCSALQLLQLSTLP